MLVAETHTVKKKKRFLRSATPQSQPPPPSGFDRYAATETDDGSSGTYAVTWPLALEGLAPGAAPLLGGLPRRALRDRRGHTVRARPLR